MYETKTYDAILEQMIAAVQEKYPTLDTREGSIIYTALAPAAVELANMYIELDNVIDESFADTQSRDFLVKRAAERGVIAKSATCAIRKGIFTPSTLEIEVGARFSHNLLNYVVVEKVSAGVYKLQCETKGTVGNDEIGLLIPIDYIEDLETATLSDVLVPGEDDEDVESLRQRYFATLSFQAFGGNVADYKAKTKAISGIGGVKVYPIWNGGGTVKLVVISSSYDVPSGTLVDDVQTAIDPVANHGEGLGLAPIGHTVTVEGVAATTVNISMDVTLDMSYLWEDVVGAVQDKIDEYFAELAEGWENENAIVVRVSQIESRLLDVEGVVDVENTKLNGTASNLTLGSDNIPVRGDVTNGEE